MSEVHKGLSIMRRLSENHPVEIALVLVSVIFLFKILDVFLFRSDELLGEQFLTKGVGIGVIFAYVWHVKGSLRSIGLHAKDWKVSVILGLLIMTAGLIMGYGTEWLYLYWSKTEPRILFAAQGNTLIPEDFATGGLGFALVLLTGNIINSFMEEGLFRGLLITHLGSRMSLIKANLAQAALFGLWHIVWPIRDYLDGKTDLVEALVISVGFTIVSGLIGFAWGYFYQKTNSLWASWSAHTLNNTVMNFVHVTTAAGIPPTLGLRASIVALTVIALLSTVRRVTNARAMTEVNVWV